VTSHPRERIRRKEGANKCSVPFAESLVNHDAVPVDTAVPGPVTIYKCTACGALTHRP
jgi:hypothetical protein